MTTAQPKAPLGPHARLLNQATVSAAILAALVFLVDTQSPLGYGLGVLYVVPLLVGTLSGPPRFQFVAASVATLLTVVGAALSPAKADMSFLLVNRGLALVVIWSTSLVLGRFRRTWLNLQESTKDLDDIKFALDQAAIVAITDTRGIIRYVNQKFCDISKYSRPELLGQDHRILNSRHHPREFMRDLWVTIANGRIWRGEIRNRAKDGSVYWVDTTIVPFLDARGKPYQYMAIRYEITDRKRTEERLREQEALARLGQMAAVVAHEVKNPIAGIRGALQVIGSRMPGDSRDRPVIGDIIARLDGRSSLARIGVVVHLTAARFDPGWKGKITMELGNLGTMPVALYPGMRICAFTFEELKSPTSKPYHQKAGAKYAFAKGPDASRLDKEVAQETAKIQKSLFDESKN